MVKPSQYHPIEQRIQAKNGRFAGPTVCRGDKTRAGAPCCSISINVSLVPMSVENIQFAFGYEIANRPDRAKIKFSSALEECDFQSLKTCGLRNFCVRAMSILKYAYYDFAIQPFQSERQLNYYVFGTVATAAADQMQNSD